MQGKGGQAGVGGDRLWAGAGITLIITLIANQAPKPAIETQNPNRHIKAGLTER